MAEEILNYTVETISLNENGGAEEANCNDITFINFGTALLIIDDVIRLEQYQEYIITGNRNEINRTKHRYRFSDRTGTQTKIGAVMRKLYI